jgi:hypothetical protein
MKHHSEHPMPLTQNEEGLAEEPTSIARQLIPESISG